MRGTASQRATMLALSLLAACGGGSSGTSTPITVAPTPTPTITPTPTPSPSASTSPLVRVFGAAPPICFAYFYSTPARAPSDPTFSGRGCSRDGMFGTGAGFLVPQVFGPMASDYLTAHMSVLGVESAGSTILTYLAPPGSLIVSPLTSILVDAGDQGRLKRAFGLDSGIFSLAQDQDLTRFDAQAALASTDEATRREGARVVAANLRAYAVNIGVHAIILNGRYDPPFDDLSTDGYRKAGEHIAGNSNVLFANDVMTQMLTRATQPGRFRPDVLSAAAHLIDAYAAAIGVQVSDRAMAARYTLGATGYLRFAINRLLRANSPEAAAAAMTVTTSQIIDHIAIYQTSPAFTSTGHFFPGTDFLEAAAGRPSVLRGDNRANPGSNGTLISNDLYANGPNLGLFPATSEIQSVSVPAAVASQITVSHADGRITVTPASGFTGMTYFDYVVRHPGGEQGTVRVYVDFR